MNNSDLPPVCLAQRLWVGEGALFLKFPRTTETDPGFSVE